MRLSASVCVNKNVISYSNCGRFLAYGVRNRLIVTLAGSDHIICENECVDIVEYLEWSINNDHILCGIWKRNSVQVYSLENPTWQCRILESEATGLCSASWSPLGTHILTTAEFNVKITIWSLVGRSVSHIECPVMQKQQALSFSHNGEYLAVILAKSAVHTLCILSTTSWRIKSEITLGSEMISPYGSPWSPDNVHVAVWERFDLSKGYVEVYSIKHNKIVGCFHNNDSLSGITNCVWSPNSQFLIFATVNETIIVLSHIGWFVLVKYCHSQVPNTGPVIYQETKDSYEILTERPITLLKLKESKLGIYKFCISSNAEYLASVTQSMPAVVWIWNLLEMTLSALLALKNPVTDLNWRQKGLTLAVTTNSSNIYLWRQTQPEILNLPDVNNVHKIIWRPDVDHTEMAVATDLFMYVLDKDSDTT